MASGALPRHPRGVLPCRTSVRPEETVFNRLSKAVEAHVAQELVLFLDPRLLESGWNAQPVVPFQKPFVFLVAILALDQLSLSTWNSKQDTSNILHSNFKPCL